MAAGCGGALERLGDSSGVSAFRFFDLVPWGVGLTGFQAGVGLALVFRIIHALCFAQSPLPTAQFAKNAQTDPQTQKAGNSFNTFGSLTGLTSILNLNSQTQTAFPCA